MFPEVLWAQRSNKDVAAKNIIYLTVKITDPEDLKIDLTAESLKLTCKSDGNPYNLDLEFFEKIDPDNSKIDSKSSGNHVSMILRKLVAQEEYWPRLTKEKIRLPYLKTDFDKWVDEDEQDAKESDDEDLGPMAGGPGGPGGPGGMDFSSLMQGAGGAAGMDFSKMFGAGAGAAGGAGGDGNFDFEKMSQLASQLGKNTEGEDFSSSDDEEDAAKVEDETKPESNIEESK